MTVRYNSSMSWKDFGRSFEDGIKGGVQAGIASGANGLLGAGVGGVVQNVTGGLLDKLNTALGTNADVNLNYNFGGVGGQNVGINQRLDGRPPIDTNSKMGEFVKATLFAQLSGKQEDADRALSAARALAGDDGVIKFPTQQFRPFSVNEVQGINLGYNGEKQTPEDAVRNLANAFAKAGVRTQAPAVQQQQQSNSFMPAPANVDQELQTIKNNFKAIVDAKTPEAKDAAAQTYAESLKKIMSRDGTIGSPYTEKPTQFSANKTGIETTDQFTGRIADAVQADMQQAAGVAGKRRLTGQEEATVQDIRRAVDTAYDKAQSTVKAVTQPVRRGALDKDEPVKVADAAPAVVVTPLKMEVAPTSQPLDEKPRMMTVAASAPALKPAINQPSASTAQPAVVVFENKGKGSLQVANVQAILENMGFATDTGGAKDNKVDGIAGKMTHAAVKKAEETLIAAGKLDGKADGKIDDKFIAALKEAQNDPKLRTALAAVSAGKDVQVAVAQNVGNPVTKGQETGRA